MKRTSLLLAGCLLAVAGVGPVHAATQHVGIDGISFDPQVVSILPGDTVSWTNHVDVVHTVTDRTCETSGDPCLFDHHLSPGEVFSVTFDDPGIVRYRCTIHGFSGTVEIAAPPGAAPDLAIADLAARPATAFGVPLTTSTLVEVRVINQGTAPAPEQTLEVAYRYRGRWHEIDRLTVPAVTIGGAVDLVARWDSATLIGEFRVRAVVDPADTLGELRETNNAHEEQVALITPIGTAPGLDLLDPLG